MKLFFILCAGLIIGLTGLKAQDAWWPLNVNADDSVGTEDGITNGGVSFVNDPIRGQVMKLDGDSGFVHLPLGLLENVDEATITCYFNWSGGADWQRIYSFGNANPNVRTWYLCPRDGLAGNNIHLTLGGPYGKWTDLNPEPIHTDIWYFAAVVKKTDSLILYLNDRVIASDTSFLTPGDLYPDSANYLGKSHWAADPTFNGMIDDVRLFKSALTKEEVMALYIPQYENAYWPLDVNADDALGTQHGITNGGVSFVNDPIRGQVLKLDGDSGFVHLPLGLLENVDEATITCYFNWSGGANWQRVYSFGNALPNVRTLYLSPNDGSGKLHITLGGPYGKWTDLSPRTIQPDIWYFAAFVKKTDSLIFYLNDQVITSDTSFLTPGDLYPDSANYLGKSHWNDPTFNGMIDDVRLYKSALTKEEVLKLFTPLYKDAYWPLDADANDAYALHNGITNEGVSFVTDPIRGHVMQLDGTTGFVHIPLGLVQDVNDVTIIANFNFAGGGNWQRVYSFGNATPDVRTLYLCPKDGSGNLHVTLGGPFGLWRDYSPVQAVENRWYFSAFVKKADSLLFYLDDQVIVADTFVTVPADLYPDSSNYLGKSHWNDPLFNGMIDDVRFITRALTKDEIMTYYAEVPTGINTITRTDDEPLIYTVRNQIVVKFNDNGSDNAELSVFDVLGKRIYYTHNLSELNYFSFREGVYLVSVVRQGKMFTEKVIIF